MGCCWTIIIIKAHIDRQLTKHNPTPKISSYTFRLLYFHYCVCAFLDCTKEDLPIDEWPEAYQPLAVLAAAFRPSRRRGTGLGACSMLQLPMSLGLT